MEYVISLLESHLRDEERFAAMVDKDKNLSTADRIAVRTSVEIAERRIPQLKMALKLLNEAELSTNARG